MPKTMRAIMARRLKFTPALLANVRRRFEGSDEPLSTMAADLGCCKTTLRGIAKRERWKRYDKPPRDLLPAARLLERAEKLAVSVAAGEPPPESGRSAAEAADEGGRVGVRAHADATSTRLAALGDLPLPGAGEESEAREGQLPLPTPEQVRDAIAVLHADVARELAEFKAFRDGLDPASFGLLERERVARTLAGLSATLHKLQVMRANADAGLATASNESAFAYDDMPADLDAFREALARRIALFMESRPDTGDAGDDGAGSAAAARS